MFTYTVKADKGSFPFQDGDDREFGLYLAYEGLYKAGDVKSIKPPAKDSKELTPRLGTQSWTQGGLSITVTGEIVKLSPEDLAKLPKTQAMDK